MPHRRVQLLLPVIRPRRRLITWSRPNAGSSERLARGNTPVVPVWRELLADLTTPVALFARCVGDGEGFLLESVDQG